ncbi:MAG: hypothetical protein KJ737_01440 [Proteobacteria bacterium]|nr:hypothetical protein [Pseudomonadota bacterium]
MNTDPKSLPRPIEKLLSIIKSFKGIVIKKKPEHPDFDQYGTSWKQTEDDYQKEQKAWLESIQKKRKKNQE